jgi:hypothetical protein
MFEGVLESVESEVTMSVAFAWLRTRGHQFRSYEGYIHGGSDGATGRTMRCLLCRRKFEFRRVSEGRWQLDKYSMKLLSYSCADIKYQNLRIRDQWQKLIEGWQKN